MKKLTNIKNKINDFYNEHESEIILGATVSVGVLAVLAGLENVVLRNKIGFVRGHLKKSIEFGIMDFNNNQDIVKRLYEESKGSDEYINALMKSMYTLGGVETMELIYKDL